MIYETIFIAAIIVGELGGFVHESLGHLGNTLIGILENSYTFYFLILILFLKLFATVTCLGLGFFGGVFFFFCQP